MKEFVEKASILIESLPYIKKYAGKTFVIKYGGHAMESEELKYSFAEDIVLLKFVGINPIIVHGGGPQIAENLKKQGLESKFIGGMRVTDAPTMDVVEMTLSGKINKEIVSLINKAGGEAIGISGRDCNLLQAKKLFAEIDDDKGGKKFSDIGLVGEVKKVNTDMLESLMGKYIPVVAPIGISESYEPYNLNADVAASAIAGALQCEKLILLTDVEAVLDKDKKRISSIKFSDIESLKRDGTLQGGMIPKVDYAGKALSEGVTKVHIIDGRVKHSVLLEIFTDSGIGTEVVRS